MPVKTTTTKQPATKQSTTWRTLTKQEGEQLVTVEDKVTDVRRLLEDLSGNDCISTIMFEVGKAFTIISECENILNEIVYQNDDKNDKYEW
jgi:hypothetical protein